jgi:hypothetical protein
MNVPTGCLLLLPTAQFLNNNSSPLLPCQTNVRNRDLARRWHTVPYFCCYNGELPKCLSEMGCLSVRAVRASWSECSSRDRLSCFISRLSDECRDNFIKRTTTSYFILPNLSFVRMITVLTRHHLRSFCATCRIIKNVRNKHGVYPSVTPFICHGYRFLALWICRDIRVPLRILRQN